MSLSIIKMRIIWLCRNWDESIRFKPELWKSFSLRRAPASGPLRCTADREFYLDLVTDPPRGRPFGGSGNHRTRWIEGNNSRIIAEYYDFHRRISFHSFIFPTCYKNIASRGCNSGEGAAKPPRALRKFVYEHFSRANSVFSEIHHHQNTIERL